MNGFIIARHITKGEFVENTTTIYEIADLSKIWIEIGVYPKDLIRVQKGQFVDVFFPDGKSTSAKIIYLSPKGKLFNHQLAKQLSQEKTINIICGHFEGVDERVLNTRNIEEISIGDFVLSGGETAAYVFIDVIVRLLPGVLGNDQSTLEESFENNLLEYPQYTKPQQWESKCVPDVLLSGDHAKIKDWRLSQSEAITRRRRPDLWEKYKKNNK